MTVDEKLGSRQKRLLPRKGSVIPVSVLTACLLAVGMLCGCQTGNPEVITGPDETVSVSCDADGVWQLCLSELTRRGFRVDRADRRTGLIQSYPRLSSQWFEFWGGDVVTPADAAEASLHTVRRRVRFEIEQLSDRDCRLTCDVDVERLSVGPRRVSGAVRACDVLNNAAGRSLADPLASRGQTHKGRWVLLGQDRTLAAHILATISKNL